jgi:hypothetical protein
VISLAYNQVIELFPNGGGGYKVATRREGRTAGAARRSRRQLTPTVISAPD